MSFDVSSIISSNSASLNSTTTFNGVVPQESFPIDAVVIEKQPETEEKKTKTTEDAKILIDKTARKSLTARKQITDKKTRKKQMSEKHIWLKMDKENQKELRGLSEEIKKMKCFSREPFSEYYRGDRIITRDVVFIEKLAGKKIFNTDVKSIKKIPISPEKLAELNESLQEVYKSKLPVDRTVRTTIYDLNRGRSHMITPAKAKQFNDFFMKTVFDLESLLAQEIQEAKKEAKLLPGCKSKKRPLDTDATSEENFESDPKQRRTGDYDMSAKDHIHVSDDNLAAITLVGLGQIEPGFPLVSSGQIDCYFQQPIESPFVSE